MRDRNAFVTRDTTGDSQHPVPTRPGPTRPALYRSRGHLPSIRPVGDAGEPRIGWMANSSSPVTTPERRDGQPHPAERLAVACPDLSTIEGVDLDDSVTCEAGRAGNRHGVKAQYLVVAVCPSCGAFKGSGPQPRIYGLCAPHWRNGRSVVQVCQGCGHRDFLCGGFLTIVEVLR